MRHKIKGRKLNVTSSHRKAMFANMAVALIMNEQIKTTIYKAKELRPYVEKLVTKARKATLSTRRFIISKINNSEAVEKLISILAVRYKNRLGGYTRIVRSGFRYGDRTAMSYIEFVDRDHSVKGGVVTKINNDNNNIKDNK